MFCQECGQKLADGTKFCPYCGAKIQAAPPLVEETTEQEETVEGVKKGRKTLMKKFDF